jgi:hypothetical protein
MAITFNDNINVSAQKPIDSRFGPYNNTGAALAAIPAGQRYIGLTVGIGTNPVVEYWFNDGIADGDFVAKTASGNLTGITAGTGISVSGTATNPIVAVTTPTQLTTNLSTNIITDAANAVKYPNVPAVKTYVDGLTVGLLNDRGSYAPSSTSPGPYPSTGGSGTAGAIMKGDIWYIRSNGYLGTTAVVTGASVRALVDSPGSTTDADWDILDAGLGFIPENSANRVLTGSSISSDPTNPTNYPSVKALTEYLSTFSGPAPTLQQVLTATPSNKSFTQQLILADTSSEDFVSAIGFGEIILSDNPAGGNIFLGTSNIIQVQLGTNYTTYESDRITFTGPGYTSTLLVQPGNQTMYLPAPSSPFQTLAVSVNGVSAGTDGNITLPSSVGSGTPFTLTMWSNPLGTSLVNSAITSTGNNVGIFNDTSNLTGGKYAVQIGIDGVMDYPLETLVVSDSTNQAAIGVYNEETTPGSGKSSIYLGNIQTSYAGAFLFAESRFVNETSLGDSTLSNNFVTRDASSGAIVDSVGNILTIHPDGAVSLNASGSGVFAAASPRLVINEDITVANPVYGLYVNSEAYFALSLEAGTLSSPSLTGTGNGLVLATNTGTLARTALPVGTLNRIPKWTATGSLSLGDSQIFDNGTNVGIGTTSPTEKLQISGNLLLTEVGVPSDNDSYSIKFQGKGTTGTNQTGEIKIDASGTAATQGCLQLSTSGFMRFSSGSAEGYVFAGSPATLRNNSGGITLQAFSTTQGIVLRNNTNQISGKLLSVVNSGLNEPLTILASSGTEGNVGINIATPARSLHIKDVMRLEPRGSAPTSPSAGDIYYSSADNTLKFYNGTTWRTISSV